MPEVFNKNGHGLTDIVIAWDEFKAVLHPEIFGEIKGSYIYCVLDWNWRPYTKSKVTALSKKSTSNLV